MDMLTSHYSFMLKYPIIEGLQHLRGHSFLDQHTGQVKFKGSWHQLLTGNFQGKSDIKGAALYTDIINHVDSTSSNRLSPTSQGLL